MLSFEGHRDMSEGKRGDIQADMPKLVRIPEWNSVGVKPGS